MPLETRYARSGEVNIAYQVVGAGPRDLIFVMGWVSHLDYFWQEPAFARFLRRLAVGARLILFDKRGTGLSDRVADLPTLEQRMDDVRAVMDAAGSARAALLGVSEGGPLCALFAATYPQRAAALIMIGAYARRLWAPDYPWGERREERERYLEHIERAWGHDVRLEARAPSRAQDAQFRQWWATYLRMSASPGAARALTRMNMEVDIRHVLPTIRAPTLIIHRAGDRTVPVEASRYMAARISGARYVEAPGADHLPFVGDQDAILDEIEQFLTGVRPAAAPDRLLTTVLVTEVVGATALAARLGERGWAEALAAFQALVDLELARFRGRAIRTTGAGLLAAFDGPARAIRCAVALADGASPLGFALRAGLHTGECDVLGDDLGGVAVEAAAAVLAAAEPHEILVSGTVKDLVAGSSIRFARRGTLAGAGLPDAWPLFRVAQEPRRPATAGPAAPDSAAPRPPAAAPSPGLHALTQRELTVLRQIAAGYSSQEMAAELALSVRTVERHITNLYTKLGVRNRAEATLYALRHGLAEPSQQ
jgi:pimeloyl-ACP methyl ester carboxylesterase/DNA-binding CsgD family transcriptional regulator